MGCIFNAKAGKRIMTASEKGLEIGKCFNDFLREKKQIPHATAKVGSPRLQGWLCGFLQAYVNIMEFDDAASHTFKSAVSVTMFDGTLIGQQMGLDILIDTQRILREGPTPGYNQLFFEFMEKGKSDGRSFFSDSNHELLLYTLL